MRPPLLVLALLLGCPQSPDPEPTPQPTPAGFDRGAYELLSYDLGVKTGEASRGALESPEGPSELVYHAARFHTDTPLRVVAVEAQFNVRRSDDRPADLAIYDDEGHNFYDFLREEPLREWELTLNKDDHDEQWLLIELDEPLVLDHPQLLYVGSRYDGAWGQPVLATDEAVSPDPFLADKMSEDEAAAYTPHVTVFPERGTDGYGFEDVAFAGRPGETSDLGDLMVRLYVERFDVVQDTWFHDATEAAGLPAASAVSWGDCDGDGWQDVFTGSLWHNDSGAFTDITATAGLESGGAGFWGDYDNDGDADLFVGATADHLYRNDGGCTFTDVTAASGIDDTQPYDSGEGEVQQHVPTVSAGWLDYDNDGWLDLYQASFMSFATEDAAVDRLWRNRGDGSFEDVTDTQGLTQGSGRAGRTVAAADWDNDGRTDVFVGNYRLQRNFAWHNTPSGFEDLANGSPLGGDPDGTSLQQVYGHTIGAAWTDVDNDGDLDLFAANLAHPRFITWSDPSMFLRNQLAESGQATFVDVAAEAGMLYQETDSSPLFLDFDNDGLLDLFYTAVYAARPSYLYRNEGDFHFRMVSYPAGTWAWNGWGAAAADYDNDGDEDIYTKVLLRNDTPQRGHWLRLLVEGSGAGATNRSGFGARVLVSTADGATRLREIVSSYGVSSQPPRVQLVGLGEHERADVDVRFPASGQVVALQDLPADSSWLVREDGSSEQLVR